MGDKDVSDCCDIGASVKRHRTYNTTHWFIMIIEPVILPLKAKQALFAYYADDFYYYLYCILNEPYGNSGWFH